MHVEISLSFFYVAPKLTSRLEGLSGIFCPGPFTKNTAFYFVLWTWKLPKCHLLIQEHKDSVQGLMLGCQDNSGNCRSFRKWVLWLTLLILPFSVALNRRYGFLSYSPSPLHLPAGVLGGPGNLWPHQDAERLFCQADSQPAPPAENDDGEAGRRERWVIGLFMSLAWK